MEAIENKDEEPNDNETKPSGFGKIFMRAAVGGLLIATMGASAVAGAIMAVGQERLYEFALSLPTAESAPNPQTHVHVSLPETIYTLAGQRPEQYLQARIVLRTSSEQRAQVAAQLPELQTVLQMFIRELSADELTGAIGLYQLRKACLHRARKIMGDDAVEDVFITDIMIQ